MMRWMGLALLVALAGCEGPGHGQEGDRDGDGVMDGADCAPDSSLAWKRVQVYPDPDGDGYGHGEPRWECVGTGLPAGVVTKGGDCDGQDPLRWRSLEGLGLYADADGDGVRASEPSRACIGADLGGYSALSGWDCDDTNPRLTIRRLLYADADGDGVGGGTLQAHCVGDELPAGLSETGGDCAPEDATRHKTHYYASRDGDGDGYSLPEEGLVCAGQSLPAGYSIFVDKTRVDCDDTRADRWSLQRQYLDEDGDGVGVWEEAVLCAGREALPGYSWRANDCAPADRIRWTSHAYYYRDADGDGAFVPMRGEVCAGDTLPSGYASWWSQPEDCDDTRASVSVSWNVYLDADGDGVGSGPRTTLCAGTTRPAGYVGTGSDCAPDDATRWRELTFAHFDADGDGYTVAAGGPVCTGSTNPPGYSATSLGPDCDDSRAEVFHTLPVYVDSDGDGVGAGSAQSVCTNHLAPPGHSLQGTDCAPDDATRWRLLKPPALDADGDGFTVRTTDEVCTGTALPPPYVAAASGNDCDDTHPALSLWRVLYPDQDGDGVGAPPRVVMCLDQTTIPPGYSIYGYDPDDTRPGGPAPADEPELELLLSEP